MKIRILLLTLVFSLCGTMARSQDTVIVSMQVGECSLSVESDEAWHTLRLRAHHPRYEGCRIDRDAMQAALSAAFSKITTPKLEGTYSSLFIGRLIDYPWLSSYLARTAHGDAGWDSKRGKPVGIGINAYVSRVLSRKELMEQMETVFAQGGYRVINVTVEKVLVGGFHDVPLYQGGMGSGKVPYDAQVWFRLERE